MRLLTEEAYSLFREYVLKVQGTVGDKECSTNKEIFYNENSHFFPSRFLLVDDSISLGFEKITFKFWGKQKVYYSGDFDTLRDETDFVHFDVGNERFELFVERLGSKIGLSLWMFSKKNGYKDVLDDVVVEQINEDKELVKEIKLLTTYIKESYIKREKMALKHLLGVVEFHILPPFI